MIRDVIRKNFRRITDKIDLVILISSFLFFMNVNFLLNVTKSIPNVKPILIAKPDSLRIGLC
jgi:hypothetical protein